MTTTVIKADSKSGANTSDMSSDAPQRDEQDDGDRDHRGDGGGAEGADDRRAGRLDGHGGAAGIGRDGCHLRDKFGEPPGVARFRLRQHLDARPPVRQHPVAGQFRQVSSAMSRLGLQRRAQPVEL